MRSYKNTRNVHAVCIFATYKFFDSQIVVLYLDRNKLLCCSKWLVNIRRKFCVYIDIYIWSELNTQATFLPGIKRDAHVVEFTPLMELQDLSSCSTRTVVPVFRCKIQSVNSNLLSLRTILVFISNILLDFYVLVSVHHKLIYIKKQRDATWQYVY